MNFFHKTDPLTRNMINNTINGRQCTRFI